jgi:hypothetical protein
VLHKLLAVWFTANKKTYYSLVLATNIACCLELWMAPKSCVTKENLAAPIQYSKFGSTNPTKGDRLFTV